MSKVAMPAHTELSPSVTKRSMNCPGWHQLKTSLTGKGKASIYAAEGTLAHWVAGNELRHIFGRDPHWKRPGAGREFGVCHTSGDVRPDTEYDKFTGGYFTFKISVEMNEAVDKYIDYCLDAAEGAQSKHVWIEERLPIPSEIGNEIPNAQLGGTTDFAVCHTFSHVEVIDFKYGVGVTVSPVQNEQAMGYALGIWFQIAKVDRDELGFIRCTIVQPRSFEGGGAKSWECSPEELEPKFYGELLKTQEKVFIQKSRDLKVGEWCQFCPVGDAMICPAKQQQTEKALQISVSDLEGKPQLPAVVEMPTDKLVKLVEMEKDVDLFFKNARKLLEERTTDGEETGYEFVDTYGNRKWAIGDTELSNEIINEIAPTARKSILKTELISPAKMEELLHKHPPTETKRTKAEAKEIVDRYTVQEVNGKKLIKKTTTTQIKVEDITK